MMKLNQISSNCHELVTSRGDLILFSYQTPVGVSLLHGITYRTSEKFSKTTTKHIGLWTRTSKVLPQNVLENVVDFVAEGKIAAAFELINTHDKPTA